MSLRRHIRLLLYVSTAWLLFWIAGLPAYYRQYSVSTMIVFDAVILPPIWFVVYTSTKRSRHGQGLKDALWWSFYITVPLFVYDAIYCGIYLDYGIAFLWIYWYLTVYYVLPWLLFPLTGWLVDRNRQLPQDR